MSRKAYPTPPMTVPGNFHTQAKKLPDVVQDYLQRTSIEKVEEEWFALHFPKSGPQLPTT